MKPLILALISALTIVAASNHDWQTGKVLDSQTVKSYAQTSATVNGTATTVGPVTTANGRLNVQTTTITSTQLLIVGTEYNYVIVDTRSKSNYTSVPNIPNAIGEALGNIRHGCRFIVNDDVKFYQDKGALHVIDADGKECKTEIVRQERIQKPVSAVTAVERPIGRPVVQPPESVRAVDLGINDRPTLKKDEPNNQAPQPNSFQVALQAAEGGDANAQAHLADLYYKGAGAPQDYPEAARWFRRAADQGQLTAQNNLGFLYFNGHGVQQSYMEAAKWYRVAAEHGSAAAQHHLAMMYFNGQGVTQDYVAAYTWANVAAAHANPNDQKTFSADRDLIAARMTPAQIEEGQGMARRASADFAAARDGVSSAGTGVIQPTVTVKVNPAYSDEALKARIGGSVALAVIVGTDGLAHDVSVIHGLGMGLDERAVEAVKQWRFSPGTKNGQPVNMKATIEVNFRLNANPASK